MGLANAVQLRQLLAFAAVGAALGLWYDLLRPLRRGWLFTAVGDVLFAVAALAVLFGAGQTTAEGALYLYMAAGCVLGFALWRAYPSAAVQRWQRALGARVRESRAVKRAKSGGRAAKNAAVTLFSSAAKWVTMELARRAESRRARKRRQTAYEASQGKLADAARDRGAAALRRRSSGADARKAG